MTDKENRVRLDRIPILISDEEWDELCRQPWRKLLLGIELAAAQAKVEGELLRELAAEFQRERRLAKTSRK